MIEAGREAFFDITRYEEGIADLGTTTQTRLVRAIYLAMAERSLRNSDKSRPS